MKFNLFTLGELVTIKYGKNQKKVQSEDGAIPIYGTGGLMGYATDALYDKPSVLIGRKGTINKVRYVDHPFWTVDTLFYTEVNEELAIPKYLYYLMSLLDLDSYNEGTTIPSLRTETLNRLEFNIPDLDYQGKVLSILEPIDKKINLNEEVNKNLQEQAIAIYSNMIIDNADDSWSTGVLSDIAEITMGQSPKGDTYNEEGIGTVFFQGRAEFGFRFPTRRLFTTDPKRMAQANDALMSVRAPVGDMNVAYEDCCIGRGLSSIRSKDSHQSFVLYTMLALREELNVFNGEGTVFGSINRDALNSMPVSIPTKAVMDKFEEIVAPMDAAIRNNYDEICRLEAIRDSLLPRLMSGELDVSELEL